MSVAAIPSPASRCKRLFEGEAVDLVGGAAAGAGTTGPAPVGQLHPHFHHHPPPKRHRAGASPPRSASNVLAALQLLFPSMDEHVLHQVLADCTTLEAAIQRLTDLRINAEEATVAVAAARASGGSPRGRGPSAASGALSPSSAAEAAAVAVAAAASPSGDPQSAAAAAAAASVVAAQQQQQQQQQEQGRSSSNNAGAAGAPNSHTAAPVEPQTADQWIDYLVSEMLAAKDMSDARARAAAVLQNFERFCKQATKAEADARVADLVKENAIYKRAVQIQAGRMQAKSGLEEEVLALRAAVQQYQEQCRRLELHAYSLAMHLQQATSSGVPGAHMGPNPPDVF